MTAISLVLVLLSAAASIAFPDGTGDAESKSSHFTLPAPGVCGVNLADRILGGTKTALNAYPWTALLITRPKAGGDPSYTCGGSLISDRFVLTAAHCFRELPDWAHVAQVRLGEWDILSEQDCDDDGQCADKSVDIDVESSSIHSGYDRVKLHNDIALIKLAKKVTFTEYISPVCLPLADELLEKSDTGMTFTVVGWGATENGLEQPGVFGSRYKLEVDVPGVDKETCQVRYPNLWDSELCAGGEAGKDSCSGDSGGCLAAPEGDGYWYQYGVVSYGKRCGRKDTPGIYARVTSYLDWIKRHMK